MSAYNHNYLKFICNLMWKMISRMVELENKRQSARLTFSNLLLKQFFWEAQTVNVFEKRSLSYLRSGLFGNISKPSLILLQNSSKKKIVYIKFKFHDDAWLKHYSKWHLPAWWRGFVHSRQTLKQKRMKRHKKNDFKKMIRWIANPCLFIMISTYLRVRRSLNFPPAFSHGHGVSRISMFPLKRRVYELISLFWWFFRNGKKGRKIEMKISKIGYVWCRVYAEVED